MIAVSVCLSVCLSVTRLNLASLCKNSRTDQDVVWREQSCGASEHCVRRGVLIFPQRGGEQLVKISSTLHPLHISVTAEARDLNFVPA